MWQALHEELSPVGLDIVTVALDSDVEAARAFVDPTTTHLALVDSAHTLVVALGITNVPSAVWVDERGTIVRAPDVAFTGRGEPPPALPAGERNRLEPLQRLMYDLAQRSHADGARYVAAVRDWARRGDGSPYAATQPEVTRRSRTMSVDAAVAAAHFELGRHLHAVGHGRDAVRHFLEAQRRDPLNWTYQRQARALADPSWNHAYGDDLMTRLSSLEPDEFYPPLDL